jgi:hypothetical protein
MPVRHGDAQQISQQMLGAADESGGNPQVVCLPIVYAGRPAR